MEHGTDGRRHGPPAMEGFPSLTATPMSRKDRARRLLPHALRTAGALALVAIGVACLWQADVVAEDHQRQITANIVPISEARAERDASLARLNALPSASDAKRSVALATEAGERVAGLQQDYLSATGPVSYEDAPEFPLEEGVYQEPRTQSQRLEVARQDRVEALNGARRVLVAYFARPAADSEGFDPSSRWQDVVEGLDSEGFDPSSRWQDVVEGLDSEGEDLSEHSWKATASPLIGWDGSSTVVWTLEDPAGEVLAVARAEHDPIAKNFRGFAIEALQAEQE